jgi:hypothetical protein
MREMRSNDTDPDTPVVSAFDLVVLGAGQREDQQSQHKPGCCIAVLGLESRGPLTDRR